MADRTIRIEADTTTVMLSNLGDLAENEAMDFNPDDLNEMHDIAEVMQQIDAYAESMELELATQMCKYTVVSPDDIERISLIDEENKEEEKRLTTDDMILRNSDFEDLERVMREAAPGDVLYLRRESGKGIWEFSVECEADDKLEIDYFDCSRNGLNRYDVLAESYYGYLCDTIAPESLGVAGMKAQLERFSIAPQVVYGELYRVVEDPETWDRRLEKIDLPGFYFLSKTTDSDDSVKNDD